jgi:HPt (histidine-containing phosphotransfer) domain-containing protein
MAGIIDWDAALEQCGGDEEFLVELLGDLNTELDDQMAKITQVLNTPVRLNIKVSKAVIDFDYFIPSHIINNKHTCLQIFTSESIMTVHRAAHVIKGAAANLMCEEIRHRASLIERASNGAMTKDTLVEQYNALCHAISNFRTALSCKY